MTALDKPAPPDLDSPLPAKPRFVDGLRAPLQGVSFIVRRPDLWLLAAVPGLVAVTVAGALSGASIGWLPKLAEWLIGPTTTWYADLGAALAAIGLTAVGVLLSIVLGLAMAQPLSGPALERLAVAMEADMGAAPRPVVPFWRSVSRSAGGALLGLAIGIPILVILTIISLVVPVAAWVTFPLQLLVSGVMVTWDLMDYPFTVRGWTLARRAAWMRAHVPAVLGFGVSLGIVLVIPCVQVLLLPAGSVGATWLYGRSTARSPSHTR